MNKWMNENTRRARSHWMYNVHCTHSKNLTTIVNFNRHNIHPFSCSCIFISFLSSFRFFFCAGVDNDAVWNSKESFKCCIFRMRKHCTQFQCVDYYCGVRRGDAGICSRRKLRGIGFKCMVVIHGVMVEYIVICIRCPTPNEIIPAFEWRLKSNPRSHHCQRRTTNFLFGWHFTLWKRTHFLRFITIFPFFGKILISESVVYFSLWHF